jgi:hypothetical protein
MNIDFTKSIIKLVYIECIIFLLICSVIVSTGYTFKHQIGIWTILVVAILSTISILDYYIRKDGLFFLMEILLIILMTFICYITW